MMSTHVCMYDLVNIELPHTSSVSLRKTKENVPSPCALTVLTSHRNGLIKNVLKYKAYKKDVALLNILLQRKFKRFHKDNTVLRVNFTVIIFYDFQEKS